jgi:peptide/nickel transport system substrate-binding protein
LLKADLPPEGIAPQLATSWELSPDKKSYTFHLRKGVKFHDGTGFNAKAVKYNFDLVLEKDKTIFHKVTSVEVVDDYTVRINMSEFNALLLYDLTTGHAFIASPTAIERLGKEGMKTNPVGTGPFKIKGFEFGLYLEAEKFDDYWQEGLPYLDGIRQDWVKDPMVAMASFENGEAHQIEVVAKDAERLRKKGYKVIGCPVVSLTLSPDSANPDSVFAKKLVREAVAYAINRRGITKAVGYGLNQPSFQVAAENSYGYNPDLKPREYNPEKAKQLLTKAGYPDGFKCTIVCSGTPEKRMFFEAIQANLGKVGIDANLKLVDHRTLSKYRLQGGTPTNSLMEEIVLVFAEYAISLRGKYLSSSRWLPEVARPAGLDDLLQAATSTESTEEKVKATQAAVKKIYDDITVIPLEVQVISRAYQPAVQNIESYCSIDLVHNWVNEVWLKQK